MDLIKALLTSPVLVAVITGFVSVLFGTQMLHAKDEQIKAKNETINALKEAHSAEVAALKLVTPARLREHVEAMKAFFEERTEQLINQHSTEREEFEARKEQLITLFLATWDLVKAYEDLKETMIDHIGRDQITEILDEYRAAHRQATQGAQEAFAEPLDEAGLADLRGVDVVPAGSTVAEQLERLSNFKSRG